MFVNISVIQMSQLNNLGKCLLLTLVLGYAVSCGFNTFYYTTRGNFEFLKAKAILIAIFLSGLLLNLVLYANDVLVPESSEAKISKQAYVLSGLITLLTATATAIFTYHTLVNLDGFTFQAGVLWFIVISSFVATCALFFKDTAEKFQALIDKVTNNKISLGTNNGKKSYSTAKFLCKLSLLVVFIIGTLGFVKTMYTALAHNVDISLVWLLTAGIIISELCFLWSSADSFVENLIKFKEIISSSKRKDQLKYIVFCIFMPIAITLALVNAFANGLLDADTFGADWGMLFIVAGTILSFCVMSSSMFNLLAPKTGVPDAGKKDSNNSAPNPAQINADMETQKPKSILMCMLSVASGISVPIMVQFKVPKPAVYAPIMLLLALFFALYYNYSLEMPTAKVQCAVKPILCEKIFKVLEDKASQVSSLFAKKS